MAAIYCEEDEDENETRSLTFVEGEENQMKKSGQKLHQSGRSGSTLSNGSVSAQAEKKP